MKNLLTIICTDENSMMVLASKLAQSCKPGFVIYLTGDLGAGKTTFVRGFLQGLGYQDKVKSPTYTLVEPYLVNNQQLFHFDLYRITDRQELEYIGIRDYFSEKTICLVEWPERGNHVLPPADLQILIKIYGEGRQISMQSLTQKGEKLLMRLKL